MRSILSIAMAAVVLAVMVASAPVAGATSGALLVATETRFRAVEPGDQYRGRISFRNDGDAKATANSFRFTGPGRSAFSIREPLEWELAATAGSDQKDFIVYFDPTSLGWKEATLTLGYYIGVGNGPDSTRSISVALRALATSNPAGVTATVRVLGPVQQGEWASGRMTLRNTAEGRVTMSEMSDSIGNVEMEIVADRCARVSLAHGDTCRVDYRLRSDRLGRPEGSTVLRPSPPYLQQRVSLPIDVTPNPAYPDDQHPTMTRVHQPVPVVLDFSGSTPRITLRLSWLGTDERTLGGYQVDVHEHFDDPWVTIIDQQPPFPDPPRPTTSVRQTIDPGFFGTRVQARDTAGNESGWISELTEYRFRDLATSATTTKTWTAISAAGRSYGGTLLRTRLAGASVAMTVHGRMLALIGRRSPDSGKIQIWVDGRKRRTVDLYASTTKEARVLATFPDEINMDHRVKVIVVESHGRTRAALDAWIGGG